MDYSIEQQIKQLQSLPDIERFLQSRGFSRSLAKQWTARCARLVRSERDESASVVSALREFRRDIQ